MTPLSRRTDRAVWPRLSKIDLGLVRILGPGLANLLFPWARAVVLARDLNIPILWPTWPQLKPGPLMRREPDTRLYANLFDPSAKYVRGAPKMWAIATQARVSEAHARSGKAGLVVVEGLADQFATLMNHRDLLRRELWEITRPSLRKSIRSMMPPIAAIHVRLGDFSRNGSGDDLRRRAQGFRIPLAWYQHVVQGLRAHMPGLEIRIFSDGSDDELEPLLRISGVTRGKAVPALQDLITMSTARILVGSASTFSLWSAFLGGMPSIWYGDAPGPALSIHGSDGEATVSMNADIPALFLERLQAQRNEPAQAWYDRI